MLLVASYGEILRSDVLELAPHGALNVHASLLPRHRGASPIQRAILAGDDETGVSVQRMVLALDEGDVLLERAHARSARTRTPASCSSASPQLGGDAAVRGARRARRGQRAFTPQDATRATYAKSSARRRDARLDADALTRSIATCAR